MLDTRTKIVPAEEAVRRPIVAAYFDPFVAAHAARLRVLAERYGPLAVCICDPPLPILPAQARAELAAACRDVELVVIGEEALAQAAQIIDEREGDLERRAALIRHVHSRQND
ncbi:MAG: hypothetical protein ACKV2U_19455 [Bryobacteraceae bacterium]